MIGIWVLATVSQLKVVAVPRNHIIAIWTFPVNFPRKSLGRQQGLMFLGESSPRTYPLPVLALHQSLTHPRIPSQASLTARVSFPSFTFPSHTLASSSHLSNTLPNSHYTFAHHALPLLHLLMPFPIWQQSLIACCPAWDPPGTFTFLPASPLT